MSSEIKNILLRLQDAYSGDPWFGRSVKSILSDVDEKIAFKKINGQHSIVELLWHMCIWREFTIDRLQNSPRSMDYFEQNDWRILDPSDRTLWKKGLEKLDEMQEQLIALLKEKKDDLLDQKVEHRKYNFRKLLNGIIEHDIYHLGQIAFVMKGSREQ